MHTCAMEIFLATTIKDIAKKIGVSHSTVSRALSGNTVIAAETTEKIRLAALEMGYQPSAAARSLKTNRSNVIGVILNNIADPFFSEIVFGIEACAQEAGYSLFIAASQHDHSREKKIVQAMMEHRTEGVIICSSSFSSEQGKQLLTYGFPIVVVNHQAAENFHYSIYHDDYDGSRQITRHLIDLGHRHIAYLGNSESGRTTLERLSGYKDEMLDAGLDIQKQLIHNQPGGDSRNGYKSVKSFLELSPRPTAIICFNDLMAIGVIKGLADAGLHVPEDISVTGFDNISMSAYSTPALTTIDQPKRSIGEEACQLLFDLIRRSRSGETFEPKEKILKGKLLVRQSTSNPKN